MKMFSLSFFFVLLATSFTQAQFSFVEVFDAPESVQVKATLKCGQCTNKAYVPVSVPKNAEGIIYSVKVVNRSEFDTPSKSLMSEVKTLSRKHEATDVADYLLPKGANKNFNLYLITEKENIDGFSACKFFYRKDKFIGTKSRAGYISTEEIGDRPFYIGIENGGNLQGLRVVVEAVAVVND